MVQSFNWPAIKQTITALLWRPHLLNPHQIYAKFSDIPFKRLFENEGVRVLILDKDNCITRPYSNQLHAPLQSAWTDCMRVFSRDSVYILSNSAGTLDDCDLKQATAIEKELGVSVIRHQTKKPSCGPELLAYLRSQPQHSGISPEQICVVGDRLTTDVLLGKLNGMQTIFLSEIIDTANDNRLAAMVRQWEWWFLERKGFLKSK